MQRVRIGLTGLAFVFLLVLLGAVISRSGEQPQPQAQVVASGAEPNEPLAELGVAPGESAADNSANLANSAP